jgi:hypothetical protein
LAYIALIRTINNYEIFVGKGKRLLKKKSIGDGKIL